MIRQNHKVVVERTVCTCDRCGKDIICEENPAEWQERFAIRFRGGYGSVFGDGNAVEGDFCQSCINQLLGKYCRIKIDDPFDSTAPATDNPEKIYQPNQLDLAEQANAYSDRISRTTADILGRRNSAEINPGS
jgi:hypothetical protein